MLEFLNEVDDREFVFFLYQLALGRDPSEEDLLNSIASLRKGLSRDNFVEDVFSSEEHVHYVYEKNTHFFVDNYLTSNLKMGDLLSIPDHIFIQSCYRIFLNRNIDSSGLKYYLGRLNKGYRRTRMIYDIVRSDEFALSAELKPIVDTITRFERKLDFFHNRIVYNHVGLDSFFTLIRGTVPMVSVIPEEKSEVNKPVDLATIINKLPTTEFQRLSTASILDSNNRLINSCNSQDDSPSGIDRILVLSVSPFDKTGVANFNVHLFSSGACEVDYFCQFGSDIDYESAIFKDNHKLTYYDVSSVLKAVKLKKYNAILVVLANSDHNIPAVIFLDRLLSLGVKNISLYIHDVVLLNVVKKLYDFKSEDFLEHVKTLISSSDFDRYKTSLEAGDFNAVVRNNVSGLNMLLKNRDVTRVFVNSEHSKSLIVNTDGYLANKISVLFHPVFDPFQASDGSFGKGLVVGTFGVPGPDKMTTIILDAFMFIQKLYPDSKLIIAGYGVHKFFKNIKINDDILQSVILDEPESTSDLLTLMRNVSVAVQLRKFSNGESSGIVPQLLSLDVPCIVSNIGSFVDFGEAVSYVDNDFTVEDLAEQIIAVSRNRYKDSELRRTYVVNHSPKKCLSLLLREIGDACTHELVENNDVA